MMAKNIFKKTDNPAKVIESLRKAFEITNAAFEFAATVTQAMTGKRPPTSPMHHLHQGMLTELHKEKPSGEMIDYYLEAMIYTAEKTQQHETGQREDPQ